MKRQDDSQFFDDEKVDWSDKLFIDGMIIPGDGLYTRENHVKDEKVKDKQVEIFFLPEENQLHLYLLIV